MLWQKDIINQKLVSGGKGDPLIWRINKLKTVNLLVKTCFLMFFLLITNACTDQEKENPSQENNLETNVISTEEPEAEKQSLSPDYRNHSAKIHSNLNGMVVEFVRTMYQDNNGTFWFGTNGDGVIRYNGEYLEQFTAK